MPTFDVKTIESDEHAESLTRVIGDRVLYAVGNTGLIKQPCAGLCGSRDASANALEWAYEFGKEAARQGVVVVSGYARGVDRQAHRGALETGGTTIAVLPEGIQHFRVSRELKASLDLGKNFLALSMFDPSAPWKVWRAMERNKLIVGLSAGLFVIEAREKGGTINAAHECIRQKRRLWAVAYSDEAPGSAGNRKLLASSAIPLKHKDDLKSALEYAMTHPPEEMRQLVMTVMAAEKEA